MDYAKQLGFGTKQFYKHAAMMAFLVALPNLTGTIIFDTPFGFKIHFFQIFIFLAAALYGPIGGAASGLFGSIYASMLMHNPYILVGNAILGAACGLLVQRGVHLILAAIIAFAVQLPWLWATDVYLVHMPEKIVTNIAIALFAGNLLWATIASAAHKKAEALLKRI